MANKKLGTAASELRLPNKKVKGEKKPKWQAKTGGKKAKEVEVAEPVAEVEVAETVAEVEVPAAADVEVVVDQAPEADAPEAVVETKN